MKVSIARGGGIAGISTVTELDTSRLPDDAATHLAAIAGAAPLEEPEPPTSPGPDQTLYEVTLEDGKHRRQARFRDDNLPDGVRKLVEWVDSRPERTHRMGR